MTALRRFLGLHGSTAAERGAARWIGAMFFASLAATFLLRPLRDQFGVDQGPARLPWLYLLTLLATAAVIPPFWWLASRMPSRRFVPWVQHAAAAALLLLALGLSAIGEYRWQEVPWLGELFWGGFSALNVVVPSLVWIHAVEHCSREQGQRLFGLIGVGGTTGAVVGSWLAGLLSQRLQAPPWVAGVCAAALLELAFLAFVRSQRYCTALGAARAAPPPRGGLWPGLQVLRRSGYVRAIGGYMLLLGALATAFATAQTELVGQGVARGRGQHSLLADVEFWSQTLVLALQLLATGRLLRRWPATVFLVALPATSVLGLAVLWLAPTVLVINAVQVVRRGAQFAFEKPAREVLYTPLDLATKHHAKFLLDTFAFRLGDLLGAVLQVELRRREFGTGGIVGVTIGLACLWIGLGMWLGRRSGRGAIR